MTGESEAGYSEIADQQLTELERQGPPDLYDAVVETCEYVLDEPGKARVRSSAITTAEGIRFRLSVRGYPDYKVFWAADGPRIEAVFPYPT